MNVIASLQSYDYDQGYHHFQYFEQINEFMMAAVQCKDVNFCYERREKFMLKIAMEMESVAKGRE